MTNCTPNAMRFLSAAAVAALAAPTGAAWPADPATPLGVGPADSFVQIRHVVAADGGTWVAWLDALCLGTLRLQRIDPAGGLLAPDGMTLPLVTDLCGTTEIMLVVAPDGSAIVRGGGVASDRFTHRVAPDGAQPWGAGLSVTDWIGGFGPALGLEGGDVLLSGYAGMSVYVTRIGPDGAEIWTAEVPTVSGPNRRVVGLVPDGAGGAFVVWDFPLAYTRRMDAARVSGAGAVLWPEPIVVVPADPSLSRHTDPVVLADGTGGVAVVFTKGTEASDTPVPLLMQRFDGSGALLFHPAGARVSHDTLRQYDPIVARDEATNELVIAWRSGPFSGQELRAQRMTLTGNHLWGADGVTVADIGPEGSSHFDAVWNGSTLAVVVSQPEPGGASVTVRHVDGSGVPAPGTIGVSGETDAMQVAAGSVGEALTISWFELDAGIDGDLVAQRLNDDGSLGTDPGDLDGDGNVGFADLSALLATWGPCAAPCAADLDGNGTVGFGDLNLLLANWG